jgi:hypothetical protein
VPIAVDYYAFWNAGQVVSVLNAVAGLVNSNAYGMLIRVVAVFGLLAVVLASIWKVRLMDVWSYVLIFALMYLGLVVPKVNVTVRDVQAGTATVVANVPLGIGFFASELTHLGYWMTTTYETAFAPAADVGRFARFGLAGPQRVLDSALRAQVQLPVVRINMSNLMKDCVIPELIDDSAKIIQISSSADVWATISASGWVNPARSTMVQVATPPEAVVNGGGTITPTPQACNDAIATTSAQLDLAVRDVTNRLATNGIATNLGLSATPATAGALSAAGSYFNSQVGNAAAILMGYTTTAEAIIKSQAGLSALQSATADVASPLGAAVGQATTVANLGTAINYRTMAQVAKDALPKLRNAIELLVVAMFPIMMILVLVAGMNSMAILKGYLIMLVWTQLWAPIYAVVNFMMITSDTSPYTQALAAVGGFSAGSMQLIADLGASSMDTAGMLALSVPVIALALAKGGEMAMSSMASGVLQPASSSAQSSGSSLGSGNNNIGNATWGNFSEGNVSRGNFQSGNSSAMQARTGANFDASNSYSDPGKYTSSSGYGTQTSVGGYGGPITSLKTADGREALATSIDSAAVTQAQQRMTAATEMATTTSARVGTAVQGASQSMQTYMSGVSSTTGGGSRNSVTDAGGRTDASVTGSSVGAENRSGLRLDESSRREAHGGASISPGGLIAGAAAGAAGGPKGAAAGVVMQVLRGVQGGGSIATGSGSTTEQGKVMSSRESAEQQGRVESALRAAKEMQGSATTQDEKRLAGNVVGSLQKLNTAMQERTAALQQKEGAERSLSEARDNSVKSSQAVPTNYSGVADGQGFLASKHPHGPGAELTSSAQVATVAASPQGQAALNAGAGFAGEFKNAEEVRSAAGSAVSALYGQGSAQATAAGNAAQGAAAAAARDGGVPSEGAGAAAAASVASGAGAVLEGSSVARDLGANAQDVRNDARLALHSGGGAGLAARQTEALGDYLTTGFTGAAQIEQQAKVGAAVSRLADYANSPAGGNPSLQTPEQRSQVRADQDLVASTLKVLTPTDAPPPPAREFTPIAAPK